VSAHRIVILDCGAVSTALGVFSRSGDQLCLHRSAVEIFPLAPNREAQWLANTCAAIHALGARVKIKGPVLLVLPAHRVLTKFIETPIVGPAQRAPIVQFAVEQNIPYALTEVAWDSVALDQNKGEVTVLLAAAKLELLEPLCAAAQAVGWVLSAILPAPLATLAAFRQQLPGQIEPSLVLHLGPDGITLLLVEATRFTLRRLSLGYPESAESAGRQAIAADEIPESLTDYISKVRIEITRSLLHFQSQNTWLIPQRVYLAGPGAARKDMVAALVAALPQPVVCLGRFQNIQKALESDFTVFAESTRWCTDLVGAAATQLWPVHPTLNLLPPSWRQRAQQRRRRRWWLASSLCLIVAGVAPITQQHNLRMEAQRKTAMLEKEMQPYRDRLTRQTSLLQHLSQQTRSLTQLEYLYERRASWLNFFSELQGHLAQLEDGWLEQIQVLPTVPAAPLQLAITGYLLDRESSQVAENTATMNRVRILLQAINSSPYVYVAEAGQNFDQTQPGILKFSCVLVLRPARPL